MKKKFLFLVLALGFLSSSGFAETYKIDLDHSTVSFKIRHLVSKTQGTFRKFEGTIDYAEGKPETWQASGTIDAASIDTNVPERDKHLKSADFFDIEKYPTISFKTTGVRDVTATSAKVDGLLNMHGVEKPITLDVTLNGIAADPWGNTRAAFSATAKIDRKEFGIVYNSTLDKGGLMLGEDVQIDLEIEAILNK